MLAPRTSQGAGSAWNVPELMTERWAGGVGEQGLGRPGRHFWAKTRGNFSPRRMSSGARPDLTPERGFLENSSCLPGSMREGRGLGGLGPVVRPARALSAGPAGHQPLAAHSNSPCTVFKLPTFLKCQRAFLSLPDMPPGDAGLAQEGGEPSPPGLRQPLAGPTPELASSRGAQRQRGGLRCHHGAGLHWQPSPGGAGAGHHPRTGPGPLQSCSAMTHQFAHKSLPPAAGRSLGAGTWAPPGVKRCTQHLLVPVHTPGWLSSWTPGVSWVTGGSFVLRQHLEGPRKPKPRLVLGTSVPPPSAREGVGLEVESVTRHDGGSVTQQRGDCDPGQRFGGPPTSWPLCEGQVRESRLALSSAWRWADVSVKVLDGAAPGEGTGAPATAPAPCVSPCGCSSVSSCPLR